MSAFFSGVIFGALLIAAAFTAYFTRSRAPKRAVIEWTEKAYEPPVTTRILIKERDLQL